jgi:hypothetical protein
VLASALLLLLLLIVRQAGLLHPALLLLLLQTLHQSRQGRQQALQYAAETPEVTWGSILAYLTWYACAASCPCALLLRQYPQVTGRPRHRLQQWPQPHRRCLYCKPFASLTAAALEPHHQQQQLQM